MLVAGDVDVDDAAGVDVGRKEDGGKLDLRGGIGQHPVICVKAIIMLFPEMLPLSRDTLMVMERHRGRDCPLTRRLSSVRSTATPASTLPTVNDTSMAKLVVSFQSMRVVFTADRNASNNLRGHLELSHACEQSLVREKRPLVAWQSKATPTPKHRSSPISFPLTGIRRR